MTALTKDIIIEELKGIPDEFANEILDFIKFLKVRKNSDEIKTHLASSSALGKDWLNPEEDEAWKDL